MDEMNNVTENVVETVKEVVVNNSWSGKEKAVVIGVIGVAFGAGIAASKPIVKCAKAVWNFGKGIARKIVGKQPKTDENIEIVK